MGSLSPSLVLRGDTQSVVVYPTTTVTAVNVSTVPGVSRPPTGVVVLGPATTQGTPVAGEVPAGARDGSNTVFSLAHLPNTSTVAVYRNGLREQPGVGYTVAGAAITFTTAPLASDALTVDYESEG